MNNWIFNSINIKCQVRGIIICADKITCVRYQAAYAMQNFTAAKAKHSGTSEYPFDGIIHKTPVQAHRCTRRSFCYEGKTLTHWHILPMYFHSERKLHVWCRKWTCSRTTRQSNAEQQRQRMRHTCSRQVATSDRCCWYFLSFVHSIRCWWPAGIGTTAEVELRWIVATVSDSGMEKCSARHLWELVPLQQICTYVASCDTWKM